MTLPRLLVRPWSDVPRRTNQQANQPTTPTSPASPVTPNSAISSATTLKSIFKPRLGSKDTATQEKRAQTNRGSEGGGIPPYDGSGDGAGGSGHADGELNKSLKSRHISMIAIGGAVGTGLIIGTGQALARAGPGSVLIAYSVVGFFVYIIMCAVGEMAAWLPLSSGFTGYAARFCDPSLGFALGWIYWFKYIIATPNNLTAAALVLQYWVPPDRISPGVWVLITGVASIAVNVVGVRFFGELQFWMSSAKVLVFLGLMLLSIVLIAGGGPNHHVTGFEYWKSPGAFKPYLDLQNQKFGQFLGVWSALLNAVFAYLGTELIGVTVGEAQNPRKSIPTAIRMTFWRILFFYVGSVFLVGLLVPYDSNELAFATKASTSASASPFVVAIQLAGIAVLPGFINGCIVLFIFSGAISDLYIATRTLYSLAVEKSAPSFLARTNKSGNPVYALAVSSTFCMLGFMTVSSDSRDVFSYFVNMISMFGLMTWISICVTHIAFARAMNAQGIPRTSLPFRGTFGVAGSWAALVFCVLVALTKDFKVFVCDNNKDDVADGDSNGACLVWRHFLTGYLGIPLFLALFLGHKLLKGHRPVHPQLADFYTGKQRIDDEEIEYLAKERAERELKGDKGWFYRRFVAWLF